MQRPYLFLHYFLARQYTFLHKYIMYVSRHLSDCKKKLFVRIALLVRVYNNKATFQFQKAEEVLNTLVVC